MWQLSEETKVCTSFLEYHAIKRLLKFWQERITRIIDISRVAIH